MPIYEYRCEHCGRDIEVFSHSAENALPPERCTCGHESSFTRRFSTFAAHASNGCGHEGECCGGAGPSEGHSCGAGCHCGHHG